MSKLLPPAIRALILINVGVFLLEPLGGGILLKWFALWPLDTALFRPWQVITYAFLHDPFHWSHILFNMFALFMFGRALESYWGARRFLFYYLVCVLTAALTQLAVQGGHGGEEVIGASGGVFGVLLAFAWYFPKAWVVSLPVPIPLPAWLFVPLYGLAELFYGVTGREQSVAHFAHLGGLAGGALCILYWHTRQRFASR